jgi:DNA polymerase-3 subunit epsilon
LTKGQLDKEGYQTGTKLPAPCAAVYYSENPNGLLFLYNTDEAVPKKSMSDAQKAALAKAQEASRQRYICQRCGTRLEQHEYGHKQCDRCEIILWAQDALTKADYILDSETTGLDTSEDEMISLAIVNMSGNVVFKSLINPIDPQAMYRTNDSGISTFMIHGIGHERLVGAPRFEDIYPELSRILNGKTVIVYNWDYDVPMLDAMCERRNLPEIEFDGWCAMEKYAQFVGEQRAKRDQKGRYRGWSYRWQKLPGGGHTALSDCLATLRLIQHMAQETDSEEQA